MDMSNLCYLEAPGMGSGFGDGGSESGAGGVILRDFLATNYGRLHRRLLRYFGCPDLASDCLHDAWLRLGNATISEVQNPEAFVYRVARNIAIDHVRGNRFLQCAGDDGAEPESFADPSPGPERVAEARSDIAGVDRALNCLPRRHRAVLVALRVDELTRDEVAGLHGVSLRSVDTMLRQALHHCAEQTGRRVAAGAGAPRRALSRTRLQTMEMKRDDPAAHWRNA